MPLTWNPAAQTDATRDPKRAFFCELCGKGYARAHELENHENSYDHQHRKRMKDMKQLMKNPGGSAKAESTDHRSKDLTGIQSFSLPGPKSATKKPTFSVISSSTSQARSGHSVLGPLLDANDPTTATPFNDPSSAVRNGWYKDRYNPAVITGCQAGCSTCHGDGQPIPL